MGESLCGQRGQRVGSGYELLEPIAVGLHDTVWEAQNDSLSRRVSVKLIRTDNADSSLIANAVVRQVHELSRRLKHPTIAELLDAGAWGDLGVYVVSSLESGSCLRDRLDARTVYSFSQQRSIMQQIVEGLSAAHDAGASHGSLTPSKVILRSELGRDALKVRLVGFGVGPLSLMNPDLSRDSRAERPSWVYWAPELAVEATASRAADAYAAAVIFFELLTGRLPPLQGIEEKSAFELLLESKHLLITACPELDDAFVDALIGCLNTDPHRRLLYWPDLKQALTEVREPPKPSPNQSTSLLLYPGVAELDAGRSRAEKWLGLSVEPGKSVSKASALLGHGDNPAGIWSGRSPEIKGVAISLAAPAQQPKFAQTLRFVQGLGAHGSILPEDLLRPKIPKPPKMPKMGKERRKELITPRLDPTVAAGAFGANLRSPPVAQELSGSRNRALWLLLGFLSLAALLILLRIVFD